MSRKSTFKLPRQWLHRWFWRATGFVVSLDALGADEGVMSRQDVAPLIRGSAGAGAPLTVMALAGGKVIGDLRLLATKEDIVVGGVQTLFDCADPQNHYALQRRRFRLPKYRPGTALLLGAANSDNYYHWLLDSLPRWKMLQVAEWKKYDYVLLHSQPNLFQNEILDRLEVPPTKRLFCSKNMVHEFDCLVVPAMPFAQWQVEPWACRWLRSLFPVTQSGSGKIYLSRRGAPRRRPVNEAELEARLGALGFACIQPEQLTVAKQAQIFSQARVVVAPHGAGLANLVFAPPGARLLELFHPQYHNVCYQQLAAACGHSYAQLDGLITESADGRLSGYRIDVPAVLQMINQLA